jgi:T-complex protein 1 subunit zeta
LVDGFDVAKRATLEFLEKFKTSVVMGDEPDREILKMIARTTLRTKVGAVCFLAFKLSLLGQVTYRLYNISTFIKSTILQLYEGLADQLTDIVVNAVIFSF